MSTTIRPEISEKNKYWIDKHRYYELKHFCLQYPIWHKSYLDLDSLAKRPLVAILPPKTVEFSDPTARCAAARLFYADRMDMVKKAAMDTDSVMADYILKAVTNGLPYNYLKARLDIPCCKDAYYKLYRRFFWLLSKERQ